MGDDSNEMRKPDSILRFISVPDLVCFADKKGKERKGKGERRVCPWGKSCLGMLGGTGRVGGSFFGFFVCLCVRLLYLFVFVRLPIK